jgi:hypothetical protein
MTMHAATALRFGTFPRVSNRPQQTVDGRAWQIAKIEGPFCWARPHGSGEPFRQYLVHGEQRCGPRDGGPGQSEAVSEQAPEAASRDQGDQRLYRKPRGTAAFVDVGRRAIASGVLAPPD